MNATRLEARFRWLAGWIESVSSSLSRTIELSASLDGELSSYVRINRNAVRQAGSVDRSRVELRLLDGDRHASGTLDICGVPNEDSARCATSLEALRAALCDSTPDPYLPALNEVVCAHRCDSGALPDLAEILGAARRAAPAMDLVGFVASGPRCRGFASTRGHRLYHERADWFFDYSIYRDSGRAVKGFVDGVAGASRGDASESIARSVAEAGRLALLLDRPAIALKPGAYRAWLAPRALADLLELLAWGGFSEQAVRTGASPLSRLNRGDAQLAGAVEICEAVEASGAPGFTTDGFVLAPRLVLVSNGRSRARLVSARSGAEFGVPRNASVFEETPTSLQMAPGSIAADAVDAQLGTGLRISNLWYLNYSDRLACGVTGMTRYATVWVENGEALGPVDPMRFDDSVYRMLGKGLVGLGERTERFVQTDTWSARSWGATHAPGALIDGFRLAL